MPDRAARPADATFGPGLTGHTHTVVLLLGLLFPLLLLGLVLAMERVERPLHEADTVGQLEDFLATARPEEVETFVSEGFAPALERYWRRRRLTGLLPGRARL